MKIKISRNMGISQKILAHIFQQYLSDRARFLVGNTRKVEANIWWVTVT